MLLSGTRLCLAFGLHDFLARLAQVLLVFHEALNLADSVLIAGYLHFLEEVHLLRGLLARIVQQVHLAPHELLTNTHIGYRLELLEAVGKPLGRREQTELLGRINHLFQHGDAHTRNLLISDYNYTLPDERIAKYPLPERDSSKLLIYDKGEINHTVFRNISELIPKGSLMIFNNTRVIQARLHFRKETGALIEVFLLEPYSPADYELMFQQKGECEWLCLVGNLKKWKGVTLRRTLDVKGTQTRLTAEHIGESGTSQRVRLAWDNAGACFADIIDAAGELPIPPYLNREHREQLTEAIIVIRKFERLDEYFAIC